MKTPPKHIVIPALLLIYLAVMVGIFGIRLYKAGEYIHFFSVIGVCLAVIVLLYFSLRRRQRLRNRDRNLDEIHNRR